MSRGRPSISARGARRLFEGGQPVGPHERRVARVLAALSPDEEPRTAPDALVAAFVESARSEADARGGADRRRSGARMRTRRTQGTRQPARLRLRLRRLGLAATVKVVAAVLVLSGGTIAAAAADVLPSPAQRVVHSLFGSWGLPAPHRPPGATTSPLAAPSSDAPKSSPSVSPSPNAATRTTTGTSAATPTDSTCSPRNRGQDDPCKTTGAEAKPDAATPTSQSTKHVGAGATNAHTPTPHKKSDH